METFEYCRHLYENNEDQAKEMGITKVNGMVVIDRKRILEHEKGKNRTRIFNEPI